MAGGVPRLPSDVSEMNISRRDFSIGSVVFIGCATRGCSCSASESGRTYKTFGCVPPPRAAGGYLARATFAQTVKTGKERLEARSGIHQLDFALAMGLYNLSKFFNVMPAFSYYQEEEGEGSNALATMEIITDRADGTVLFGLNLLREILKKLPRPDAAIMSVCAHEFAHIAAMKMKLNEKLAPDPTDPFRMEQHADFMSGYYAGARTLSDKKFPAVAFVITQRSLVGYERKTHGSKEQRGAAVEAGFKAGFDQKMQFSAAMDAAVAYAMEVT